LLLSFVGRNQSAQGLYWFMFLGVDRGVLCGAHLFVNWHPGRIGAGGCGSSGEKWHQIFSV
jgi:hypothetical protein